MARVRVCVHFDCREGRCYKTSIALFRASTDLCRLRKEGRYARSASIDLLHVRHLLHVRVRIKDKTSLSRENFL